MTSSVQAEPCVPPESSSIFIAALGLPKGEFSASLMCFLCNQVHTQFLFRHGEWTAHVYETVFD